MDPTPPGAGDPNQPADLAAMIERMLRDGAADPQVAATLRGMAWMAAAGGSQELGIHDVSDGLRISFPANYRIKLTGRGRRFATTTHDRTVVGQSLPNEPRPCSLCGVVRPLRASYA